MYDLNANTMTTYLYQTQGMIKHIRTKISDYQVVDITIHPSIPLPVQGYHPVSIKIAGTWYKAIASVVSTLTGNNGKAVKAYIYKMNQQIYEGNVLISWGNDLSTLKKTLQQESFRKASNL